MILGAFFLFEYRAEKQTDTQTNGGVSNQLRSHVVIRTGRSRSSAVGDGHATLFTQLLLQSAHGERVHDGHDD